jgi:hypothetical protein
MRSGLILALLVLGLASPGFTQPVPPIRDLPATGGVQRPAAQTQDADIFAFVGESGSQQRFTVTSAKPVEITLFSPSGAPMLTKEGTGTVTLDAVLSWLDVHTVAVLRSSPSTPYVIQRRATLPTITQAIFARRVGQEITFKDGTKETKCWIVPGEKQGSVGEQRTHTLSRLGQTIITIVPNGPTNVSVRELSFWAEGEDVVESWRIYPGGKEEEQAFSPALSTFQVPPNAGPYTGYYCPGVKPVH